MDGHRLAVSRLLPPTGLPRAIAYQIVMVAVGSGTFLSGGVVFFTEVPRPHLVQIGTGPSIAGVVTSLPLDMVADRPGGQWSWAVGSLCATVTPAANTRL
ncbi:hypothetical protein [Micromonospora sp. HUAS LYJ1]|jgi:hypothetical protein|nr:hypothetical protein [Micromonospora sp. HUAS LYJ1]WKU05425.1 hypothetical protein Q2K16_32605 [Micromonospora sp. HUAS LYJ1]